MPSRRGERPFQAERVTREKVERFSCGWYVRGLELEHGRLKR